VKPEPTKIDLTSRGRRLFICRHPSVGGKHDVYASVSVKGDTLATAVGEIAECWLDYRNGEVFEPWPRFWVGGACFHLAAEDAASIEHELSPFGLRIRRDTDAANELVG